MTPNDAATLVMFPGQGSIEPHAGLRWMDDPAWSLISTISSVADFDVEHLLVHADEDEIVRTDNAQIATFALSMVSYRAYLREAREPQHFVGHSLGEFSALVAAGVLSLEDGVRTVAARGRAMLMAAQREPGSMAALMGGIDGDVSKVVELDGIWLGNVNGHDQLVVSGRTSALTDLAENVIRYGWKKCRMLRVGGAFHSPLMAPAADELRHALSRATFQETDKTIYANVDGQPYHGGPVWRTLAERQLTEPVQFLACIESAAHSVSAAVEMQPSGVLRGLVKRIAPSIELSHFEGGHR